MELGKGFMAAPLPMRIRADKSAMAERPRLLRIEKCPRNRPMRAGIRIRIPRMMRNSDTADASFEQIFGRFGSTF